MSPVVVKGPPRHSRSMSLSSLAYF
jgi:hypothetical protein